MLLGLVEPATDGAGLLSAEIDRSVLEVSVVLAELSTLGLVVDGEDAGDVLPDNAAIKIEKYVIKITKSLFLCFYYLHLGELGATRASDLGDAELGELSLHLIELLEEISLAGLAEFESLDLSYTCIHIRKKIKVRKGMLLLCCCFTHY